MHATRAARRVGDRSSVGARASSGASTTTLARGGGSGRIDGCSASSQFIGSPAAQSMRSVKALSQCPQSSCAQSSCAQRWAGSFHTTERAQSSRRRESSTAIPAPRPLRAGQWPKCHSAGFSQCRCAAGRKSRVSFHLRVFLAREERAFMPGYTDKSRKYLRLADEQTHRAEAALGAKSKSMYLQLAKQYRDLAEQIDDPAHWRARPMPADKSKKGTPGAD